MSTPTKEKILIIGAGLAGLTAAWQLATAGRSVRLIAKGWGATHWHAGCIDVLGYYPLDSQTAVSSPASAVAQLIADNPLHPYALVGVAGIDAALQALQTLCAAVGYPLHGSVDKNWLLPSAVGTLRPTCLAPEMMTAGDLSSPAPMLLVGFERFGDFFPNVAAENLSQQGFPATSIMLDLPTLRQQRVLNGVLLARLMAQPAFQAEVITALRPHLGQAERIGFPAVLGLKNSLAVKAALEEALQRPIFEIPILPPSVPGMRLHHILKQAIEGAGGRVFDGMEVVAMAAADSWITAVYSEAAARNKRHRFDQYILASGGILGGGITTNFEGQAQEVIFQLPVSAPSSRLEWFQQAFMDKAGHPIYRAGLTVNAQFQPDNGHGGHPIYDNLYAAGTTLAHSEVIRERSLEGVAIATGYAVGQQLKKEPL